MKRPIGLSDEDWDQMIVRRRALAIDRMTKADLQAGFITLPQIESAARLWKCSTHAAEMRLRTGEAPEGWGEVDV